MRPSCRASPSSPSPFCGRATAIPGSRASSTGSPPTLPPPSAATATSTAPSSSRAPKRTPGGEPMAPRFFREGEHGGAPRSLSLWRDLESVFAFAYAHVHAEALSHRKEWFLPPAWPAYVAWWVADGHTPDWHEATVRLEHLHDHGPTAFAFHFKQAFGSDGHPVELDRTRVKALVRKNAGTPPV